MYTDKHKIARQAINSLKSGHIGTTAHVTTAEKKKDYCKVSAGIYVKSGVF